MRSLPRFSPASRARGFSLLEVLIAVVIMSVGLLALAALQMSLIRSSNETKAQTTAVALAKNQAETMKSFLDSTAYRDLQTVVKPTTDNVLDITNGAGSLGGINFKRWQEVKRYVFNGASFVDLCPGSQATTPCANNTATDADLIAANSAYVPGNEFKRVAISVAWVDAQGNEQTVTIEDAISSINPADSLLIDDLATIKPRGPKVLIDNPEAQAGVIPVAMGNGSDTAATNPKPEVGSNNTGTSFDVLTYKSDAVLTNPVLAQERVETTLVKCRCAIPTSAQTGGSYRPTYWNGFRYTAPEEIPQATYTRKGIELSTAASTQTDKCIACCRDHHDTITGYTTKVKFDPRRTTHAHARYISNVLTTVSSGEYLEACRVIRVDGFNRIATDMFADHFALIPTKTSLDNRIAGSPIPSTAGKDGYEAFVKEYLKQRIVDVDDDEVDVPANSDYNTPLSDTANTAIENSSPVLINAPASISLSKTVNPTDDRWVHSRGLYIDYLQTEALEVIKDRKKNCLANVSDCVLPVLPFTSINTSELTEWTTVNVNPSAPTTTTPTDNRVISVENNSAQSPLTGDGTSPVRGKVQARSSTNGQTANAKGQFGPSNSALALQKPIDLDDVPNLSAPTEFYRYDAQLFEVGTSVVPPSSSFTVNLLSSDPSFPVGSFPAVDYGIGNEAAQCSGSANPVVCDPTAALGVQGTVTVSRYNDNTPRNKSVPNPCQANKVSSLPYKLEFDVLSATVDSIPATNIGVSNQDTFYSAVAPITPGESTTATFTVISDNSVVNITFGNLQYFCPTGFAVNGSGTPTGGFTCGGPGNNTPTFVTTFTACYSGFAP